MAGKRVAVVLEHRFYRVGDDVYTALSFPYDYWQEYLQYFDEVNVVARVKEVPEVLPNFVKASGNFVNFTDVPYYQGPKEFFKNLPFLIWTLAKTAKGNRAFVLRSGNITNLIFFFILIYQRGYLREYPGNIKEGIKGFSGESPIIKLVAWFSDWFAKLQGKFSKANGFVSDYCQGIYGSDKPGYVFSSFNSDEIKTKKSDYSLSKGGVVQLVSVGRLEAEKGHWNLLDAMRILTERGEPVRLTLIGGGGELPKLQEKAASFELDVEFCGALTDRKELFSRVANSDVFVIPSLTEGMPRALLEAMAIGLPCVGTRVGGIPEVLAKHDMVTPGDPDELAAAITRFRDPEIRAARGLRNRKLITEHFGNSALREKRRMFWGNLYV